MTPGWSECSHGLLTYLLSAHTRNGWKGDRQSRQQALNGTTLQATLQAPCLPHAVALGFLAGDLRGLSTRVYLLGSWAWCMGECDSLLFMCFSHRHEQMLLTPDSSQATD